VIVVETRVRQTKAEDDTEGCCTKQNGSYRWVYLNRRTISRIGQHDVIIEPGASEDDENSKERPK
jgi:hypothetical protein